MNWDQIAGQWKQIKGKAKTKWGKLTDDEIDVIEGKRDQLVGKIQQRYGIDKDKAEKEVDEWTREFKPLLCRSVCLEGERSGPTLNAFNRFFDFRLNEP